MTFTLSHFLYFLCDISARTPLAEEMKEIHETPVAPEFLEVAMFPEGQKMKARAFEETGSLNLC